LIRSAARFFLASLLAAACLAAAQDRPANLEASSAWTPKKLATAKRYMVAAANPLAVDAGLRMLGRGGSAIDAMIAAQLVLALVEPQSSGLGGGGYALYYEARSKRLHAYDGRETAPWGATPALFTSGDGTPMAYSRAKAGGRAVGVPGIPRLLEVMHARHGALPWPALFEPAIALAERGFSISPRLARLAGHEAFTEPAARAYLLGPDGRAKPAGTLLRNAPLAATLKAIAARGADAFYGGEIAAEIAAAVQGHANAGTLSLDDLAGYRVREAQVVCGPYRLYRICGVGPSTAGGIAVLQVMGALERFDMARVRPGSAESVHLISEAQRLAYADRNRYGGDERFVTVPVQGLLDPEYVAGRSRLIHSEKSMARAAPGEPRGVAVTLRDDVVDAIAGTTHISIVDREGNAVALTSSVEGGFGSGLMVRGFFLNNQLTDFNFVPVENGVAVANSLAPGKRPRSSMAPMLVFERRSGALEMALGSPGGSLIINYVAKALVATLDWKMDMQSAIDLPNFGSRNGPTEIEAGTELEAIAPALKAIGHDVRAIEMTSGLHGFRRTASGWQGGADPRREGVARGR
jgi:gamma-glutamyltranspeptidase / glutathione hydrolase